VSDTGYGIASEYLGKDFEPFSVTQPLGKSMGFGLNAA
jgi:C4-dicarboxylate-specific signal transduction histidine kinase